MLPWPRQSLPVWNWSMRAPLLNLICCWALHCGSTSGREIRVFAWTSGWGRDQTLLLGVLLPSHQSCSLPPQVSIRGKTASDVWHVTVWWWMSYETGTLNRKMYYLCFSLHLVYVSPDIKINTCFIAAIRLEKITSNFMLVLGKHQT